MRPGLSLSITGHSADGTGLGRHEFDSGDASKPAAKPSTMPFHVSAHLDHLVMRDGVSIAPLSLDASGVGDRLQSLAMSGALGKDAKFGASLSTADGVRQVNFNSNDAGLLIKGLFGFDSIRGGTLDLTREILAAAGEERHRQAARRLCGRHRDEATSR